MVTPSPLARPAIIPPLRHKRVIRGMSAILLPLLHGKIDWRSWEQHLERTWLAGLTPAVNMDTGFTHLLSPSLRQDILQQTAKLAHGRPFVAGVFVHDHPLDPCSLAPYLHQVDLIRSLGGLPILFPSFGLCHTSDHQLLSYLDTINQRCDRFLAFELGNAFAPFGKIFSLSIFQRILELPNCIGLKHSSLRRDLEWARLAAKDELRPDFLLLTGNDLAIDMVFYGSDYLLGLSTFAPDLFAKRDAWWAQGDPRSLMLNDLLQYLGFVSFRPPVPAYKHSAAQFLKLRGWIPSDESFPDSPLRPESDRSQLQEIWNQLQPWVDEPLHQA